MNTPEPFQVAVGDDALADLADRLGRTRWTPEPDEAGWRYGTSGAYLRDLLVHWSHGYDWRVHERQMNRHQHFRVDIAGVTVHNMRVPGRGPSPLPLVLTHGWPWTFWDFHKVVGPLADPAAHGGDPADSFDVVVPSLPGFGFSTPLRRRGIAIPQIADLWVRLMTEVLGFERFAAHGGDWGAAVTAQLGSAHVDRVLAAHVSLALPADVFSRFPGPEEEQPRALVDDLRTFFRTVR